MFSKKVGAQGILLSSLSSGLSLAYVSGPYSFTGFFPAQTSSLSYCLTSLIPIFLFPFPVYAQHLPSWHGLSAKRKPAMDFLGSGLEATPLHPTHPILGSLQGSQ